MIKYKECKKCINNESNPTINISPNGFCNVCNDYLEGFNKDDLKNELNFIKDYAGNNKYDCMVALSGGKDSTSMLLDTLELGFHPLSFSFDIGYNSFSESAFEKMNVLTKKLSVPYEIINAHKYITNNDKKCFTKMAEIYDKAEKGIITKKDFKKLYLEGRKYYSTKEIVEFPFVRPCQICRKIAIRAYYAEAVIRNIRFVFVGINEWASKKYGVYSSIRKIQPRNDCSAVYIVHLPFLLQRTHGYVEQNLKKLEKYGLNIDAAVRTGGNSCNLAAACEYKAHKLLGFHLDSARLSREVTVGFINRQTALNAIDSYNKNSTIDLFKLLYEAQIIERR